MWLRESVHTVVGAVVDHASLENLLCLVSIVRTWVNPFMPDATRLASTLRTDDDFIYATNYLDVRTVLVYSKDVATDDDVTTQPSRFNLFDQSECSFLFFL